MFRFAEDFLLQRRSSDAHHLYIETTSAAAQFIDQIYAACVRSNITLESLKVRAEPELSTIEVAARIPDTALLAHLIDELRALPGVRAVHTDAYGISKGNLIAKDTTRKES